MKKNHYKIFACHRHFFLLFLLSLFFNVVQAQQTGKVRGKVTDERDQSIPGATVSVKGTSTGASTNINGEYAINVTAGAVLVFKSVGYQTVEVAVGSRTVIDVKLKPAAIGLEEITVSYGKQRQRDVTGSIATVSAAPLADMPVMQFGQQLQGKVAGVDVSQSSGKPGNGISFRIRGAASLTTDYQPLFVVDGMPVTGSINNINPDEIETFTILKDAASSALYGSRAANGVVLITTKHAKPGDSKVEFSSQYGVQKIPRGSVPKTMNAYQWATFMKERAEDGLKYEPNYKITPEYHAAYDNPDQYGEGTNWFNLTTQSAPIQSYSLSLLSAREKSSSAVIFGYEAQDGVVINTGTKLLSLRINQDLSLGSSNKVKIGFNIAPSYRMDHNNRGTAPASDGVNGYYENMLEASPLISPYNADGTYTIGAYSPGMVAYNNPVARLKESRDDYITTRILGNGYVNYEFLPGFSLKTNVGIDKGAETRSYFLPQIANNSAVTLPNATVGTSSSVDNYSYTAEANLDYEKTFLTNHHIEALAGYSIQRFEQKSNSISGQGFPSDQIPYLSAATSITSGSSNTTQYSMLSQYGRLNYDYKGKYLLSGSIRRDGSSRFGANSKFGYFPAVSAGWIISDESFMQQFSKINLLKIRASYGITGNNTFGNFTAVPLLSNYNYILNGALASGQTIGTLGNPDLAWERNRQLDLALDLSILNNRISFTYDFYHKFSDGLIYPRPIPRASGFTTIQFNIGQFEFWGHEFSVNTVNTTGKLKWNTNLNIAFERNLIDKLVPPGYIRRNTGVSSDYYRNQEGHHLGEFYGFVWLGLYKDAADLANSAKYVSGSNKSDIGTLKMKDINGDGVIDDVNDRTFIGDPTPDFTFGLTNTFNYKAFDLSITMSGQVGGKILAAGKWAYLTNMDGSRLPLAAALDHWRSEADPGSGIYPRTETNTTAIGREVNSQWVENGTYLTAKNISLGYNIKLKNNLMLKNLRVFASVQQAFIITGYSGANPEISLVGQDALSGIGVDENGYPVPRTFSVGVRTTFK